MREESADGCVGDGDALVKCWAETLFIQGFIHLEGTGRRQPVTPLPAIRGVFVSTNCSACMSFDTRRGAGSHCRFRSIGMSHVMVCTLKKTPLREVPDKTLTTYKKLHSYSFQTVSPTG